MFLRLDDEAYGSIQAGAMFVASSFRRWLIFLLKKLVDIAIRLLAATMSIISRNEIYARIKLFISEYISDYQSNWYRKAQ